MLIIILELKLRLIIIKSPITEWCARLSEREQKHKCGSRSAAGVISPRNATNVDNNDKLAKKLVNYNEGERSLAEMFVSWELQAKSLFHQ